MSDVTPKAVTREEFNRGLVSALDDLVRDMKYHGELIQEGLARSEHLRRQRALEARETPLPYNGGTTERFDRLDEALESLTRRVVEVKGEVADVKRDVADIRERMATKVELEETNQNVKRMADGYATTQQRLDRVADMLKRT